MTAARFQVPLATYRLQFHHRFGFSDARALAGYLERLGVDAIYSSPLLEARSDSAHGYDVINPLRLNPRLGSEAQFEELVRELHERGMGLVLDIVPNHMAACDENPWWMDVLENGARSPFAHFFDVDWNAPNPSLQQKVLLPILSSPYGLALENQEFRLALEEKGFFVSYQRTKLPVAAASYRQILCHRLESLEEARGTEDGAVRDLRGLLRDIEDLAAPAAGTMPAEERAAQARIRGKLWQLYRTEEAVKTFIDENLRAFQGQRGDPRSFDLLDRLLAGQFYWLSFWRLAAEEINYRRFFAISELVSLRQEEAAVFQATHALVFELARAGKISGVRVDHIDGLVDPSGYLQSLKENLAPEAAGPSTACHIVVEKILSGEESLPAEWPVCGTTGYDFLNTLNGIFIDPRGLRAFGAIYSKFTGAEQTFVEVAYKKKKLIMGTQFAGEINALARFFGVLVAQDRYARDLPRKELARALVEVTACLPVYRTYTAGFKVLPRDRRVIETAVEEAVRRNPDISAEIFDFLRRFLLLEWPAYLSAEHWEARLSLVKRWQQYTGPIMAKGVEDTALYVYNRLLSANEVGGDPQSPAVSLEVFHRRLRARRQLWPYTLNATETHDTKRAEDARARLNVLSEMPKTWAKHLSRWGRWHRARKGLVDANAAVFLYQTLLGAWPLRREETASFRQRMRQHMTKAAREAAEHTSWSRPNAEYERALEDFVDYLFLHKKFLRDFLRFHRDVSLLGAVNSLAQVLLKIAAPGIPDFYQGSELWDFRLVDPDNRGPVDFSRRRELLECLNAANPRRLLSEWPSGRVKLYVTWKALSFRREHRELFLQGDYVPLKATSEHACAFARRLESQWALAVAPRLAALLCGRAKFPIGRRVWRDGTLVLPDDSPDHWVNVLTGESLRARISRKQKVLRLRDIFASFPVALLEPAAP